MNIFALSGFINGALFILMGGFVFLKNRALKLNQLFTLFCLGGAMWAISYGFWQMAKSEPEAFFHLRLLMTGGVLFTFFMCCCFLEIAGLREKKRELLFVFFIINLIIIFLFFTPYFSTGVRKLSFYPYWPVGGWVFSFFLLGVCFQGFYTLYLLSKKMKHLVGLERERIKYLMIAFLIVALGVGINNSPQWYGIDFPPYGNFILFLSPLILSFAILKYHLFEIKVILTELLVGVMGVVLLILPFLVITPTLKILTISIFLLFFIIGYFLIKSTHREIRAKEILEEKVEERTKELKESKGELEKFYRLTVGRELRMVELKKEIKKKDERIKELEEKIK